MEIYEEAEGRTDLLLGNEAIARGAIEAGVDVAASYPGTPASEIMETLGKASQELNFHTEWSTNEKVAFEVAAGASITGVRSLVSMKNAGLNWVMDPFMTIVYGGIRGGFVIIVADDPGAHYSSNEQDTRPAAAYAEIPCLEPSNQKEAKEMTKFAFELSEKIELPVFVRSVTRVSHALGKVEFEEINKEEQSPVFDRHYKSPYRWNVYGNTGPIERHRWLKKQQKVIREETRDLAWDKLDIPNDANLGILSSGIGYSYAKEALENLELVEDVAFLKIGTSYPLPRKKVAKFLQSVKKVLVVEEGSEFIERRVKEIAKDEAPNVEILGRLTGNIPEVDEISSDIVEKTLLEITGGGEREGKVSEEVKKEIESLTTPRSPTFCAGCPHLGTYWGLRKVIEELEDQVQIVNGDIGCYEMAGYGVSRELEGSVTEKSQKYEIDSPYDIIDTNYVMGSGIGLMEGQSQAGYKDGPLIAVAGDSTFFHATLPEVVNAVYNDVNGLFIILDNRWTCMTGHHPNPGSGERIAGEESKRLDIGEIARAFGVENVYEVNSYDVEEVAEVIEKGINQESFSIVVSKHPCAIEGLRRDEISRKEIVVNSEDCISCHNCVELGCPAITYENETGGIDRNVCVECGLCTKICPTDALMIGK